LIIVTPAAVRVHAHWAVELELPNIVAILTAMPPMRLGIANRFRRNSGAQETGVSRNGSSLKPDELA
jgi:hypothetical protein